MRYSFPAHIRSQGKERRYQNTGFNIQTIIKFELIKKNNDLPDSQLLWRYTYEKLLLAKKEEYQRIEVIKNEFFYRADQPMMSALTLKYRTKFLYFFKLKSLTKRSRNFFVPNFSGSISQSC